MTLTSTWELPVLTTLHLNKITLSHDSTDNFSGLGLISMECELEESHLKLLRNCGNRIILNSNIFSFPTSNLTLEEVYWNPRLLSLSVVAPQLKNPIIRRFANTSTGLGIMISAPDLAYLLLQCYDFINFSADGFHSLEKADISITMPYKKDPQNIVGLFQLLRNKWQLPREIVNMSTEVKNYLLDGSPGATFTMVSREEIIAEENATYAKNRMAELQVLLEQQKADMEINRAHTEQEYVPMESHNAKTDVEQNPLDENELQIEGNVEHINSCWESLGEQIKQGKEKIDDIVARVATVYQAQPASIAGQPVVHIGAPGPTVIPGQETTLPHSFSVMTLQDPASCA
ncbi:hypothetical protein Tco_0109336 [Tanacetum coccineum]